MTQLQVGYLLSGCAFVLHIVLTLMLAVRTKDRELNIAWLILLCGLASLIVRGPIVLPQ